VLTLNTADAEQVANLAGDGARGDGRELRVDALLVATGRAPNVESLGLEAAGVTFDSRRGVHVDDHLATSNPAIHAAGDVCSALKFTHAADFQARIAVQNALFSLGPLGRKRVSALTIPWCTYSDPELAHVGLSEADATERGVALDTYAAPLSDNDRARLDGATEGFVKLHARRGTDRLVGATVVARHAGELIAELTLALRAGIRLGTLADTIHPYPTQADAVRAAASGYTRGRLTPRVERLLRAWLAWRRG
jgi:pyruvate/2-oxoglutarate dehydrogenase complex dihydrolipoamide dehydrogenase (E3) component